MTTKKGQIYLYGEQHHNEAMEKKQLELWYNHYHNDGMRHLFVEYPYYTAEFLNIWMKADDNEILDMLIDDLKLHSEAGEMGEDFANMVKFFEMLKAHLPETVFHGTDIGHQYDMGQKFLQHLRDNGLEGSEKYRIAQENIEQGVLYRDKLQANDSRRSEMMVQNFIREFDALGGESVMSLFYGMEHVCFGNYPDSHGGGVTMASRLKERYGDNLHAVSLIDLMETVGTPEEVVIAGRPYTAQFFGKNNIGHGHPTIADIAFWRLDNAYDEFAGNAPTGDWLPYNNYPTPVKSRDVFVIAYTMKSGEIMRMYHRADEGAVYEGKPATVGFVVEEE